MNQDQNKWAYQEGDLYLGNCLEVMRRLPEDSVDLIFGSPPYEDSRLYLEDGRDLSISRDTEEWVRWWYGQRGHYEA